MQTKKNQSPNQDSIRPLSTQEISIQFAQSKELAVDIPVDTQVHIDIYLDNFITVLPDIGKNRDRVNTTMPLAIQAVSLPLSQK